MAPEDALPPAVAESYPGYLEALLAGDWRRCRAIFEAWLHAGVDLRTIYQDLVHRSLHDVGSKWQRGEVSVATEHLATAITDSLLGLTYPRLFNTPRTGQSAVVTCLANEHHQIGPKMVADLFELHGWRGYFLGANTPLPDVITLIREKQPDAVALSLTVPQGLDTLLRAMAAIREVFPDMPLLVGGQAFEWEGRDRIEGIPGVRYLATLAELERWIQSAPPHAR